MFNLLPENFKESIKREYSFRKWTIILFFVLLLQITFLIFIFPTWLVSFYKEDVVSNEYEKFNQIASNTSTEEVVGRIKSINQKLGILNNTLNYPKLIPYIDNVLEEKSSSIFIDQFSFTVSNDKKATLAVSGVAKTRESLVSFVDRLKGTESFMEVNLPISNLAKDRDIDFTVELIIEEK